MTSPRFKTYGLTIAAAALVLLSAAPADASPAYVTSTVNLRAAAGTSNEIVAKIPAGSLVDASNCSEWCEVTWQDKKGFAIATALDLSGHVPAAARRAPPHRYAAGGYVDDDYVPVGPPVVYGPPPVYYGYGYGPYWGGGWGYHRWRRW